MAMSENTGNLRDFVLQRGDLSHQMEIFPQSRWMSKIKSARNNKGISYN